MLRRLAVRLAWLALVGLLLPLTNAAFATTNAPPAPVRTIVVFGDSQAQGVAGALQRMFVRDRNTHVIDKTVPGTALSLRLQFDWVGTIEHWLATEHADVAIVMFGGNDRLAVRLEAGSHAIAYKSDAWKDMYAERVNNVLKAFAAANVPVLWLGQPVARETDYTSDMAFLNTIYQDVVPASGADFMPMWTIIADEAGNYAAYGKGLDGETKRLRQDDGVHFTPAGYDIIAVQVRAHIEALLAKAAGAPPATSTAAASVPAAAPTPAAPPQQATAPHNAAAPSQPDHGPAESPTLPAENQSPATPLPAILPAVTPAVADSAAHS